MYRDIKEELTSPTATFGLVIGGIDRCTVTLRKNSPRQLIEIQNQIYLYRGYRDIKEELTSPTIKPYTCLSTVGNLYRDIKEELTSPTDLGPIEPETAEKCTVTLRKNSPRQLGS